MSKLPDIIYLIVDDHSEPAQVWGPDGWHPAVGCKACYYETEAEALLQRKELGKGVIYKYKMRE